MNKTQRLWLIFCSKDEDKCIDDGQEEDWAITYDFWIKPRGFGKNSWAFDLFIVLANQIGQF